MAGSYDDDYSVYYTSWRFAQGFILGQIFVIAVLILVVRYLLLDDADGHHHRRSASSRRSSLSRAYGAAPAPGSGHSTGDTTPGPSQPPPSTFRQGLRRLDSYLGSYYASLGPTAPLAFTSRPNHIATVRQGNAQLPPIRHLFDRVGCDFAHTRTESCEWVNLFVAQLLARYRASPAIQHHWVHRLTRWINAPDVRPSMLGHVTLHTFHLGSSLPIVKSVKVVPLVAENALQWHLNVDLADQLTVGIDTKVLLNWPKASLAALPVSLSVTLARFTGTVTLEFLPDNPLAVAVSVLPGYELEWDVQSLLGHRAKVQNLPKIKELIVEQIRAEFTRHLVAPAFQAVPLPTFASSSSASGRSLAEKPSSGAKVRSRPFKWGDSST
ncbi:ERMES complex subunit mmm1 [Tieghemiomyces parasiticus]|uniref:Maintenance of mitochondrial morphology protein 1 n=1 Tax=Tieghemiomyces parasiticus TaxID=78921 RepID=A0A9W8A807_9FUNG|nr:ERMES complex subunit mmm1 [Tieghemiomyces parasiticus]